MKVPTVLLVCIGALAAGGGSWAQEGLPFESAGERVAWFGDSLGIHPGIVESIAAFQSGDETVSMVSAEAIARMVRTETFHTVREALDRMAREGCRPFVRVSFPDPDEWRLTEPDSPSRKFLEGMVRTEAVACFSTEQDPETVLDLYTSPDFRMKAESRIEAMVNEGDLSCVRTRGVPVLLDPTHVCNQIHRLGESGLAAEHSQVVRNVGIEHVQPVYLKESLKTFLSTPQGLAFHYVNFSRSVDLGWSTRWIAEGKIKESEERQIEALRTAIERN